MKFSVITPSYNQAEFIEETLRCIHRQKGRFEIEHLVIDGGSNDGTVEILERWKDRLWYISEPDRGQSHALNKGLGRATGDIIVWLNSDDLIYDHTLQTVHQYFSDHPRKMWAYGKARMIDEHNNEIRRLITFYKNLLLRRYSYAKLLLENFISQPATFFRKSLVDRVGGIDESLVYDMDYDLWLKFGKLCDPGYIDAYLGAFRFYTGCKTGGEIEKTLRVAHILSKKYAIQSKRRWVIPLNYLWYYKRTHLIYKLLDRRSDSTV